TKAAFLAGGDKRLGVVWHTTGSGKSLTMVYLVGILRRLPELGNPTIVLQVDRTDLDDQLHDHFVAASTLIGRVKHAESREQLRELLTSPPPDVRSSRSCSRLSACFTRPMSVLAATKWSWSWSSRSVRSTCRTIVGFPSSGSRRRMPTRYTIVSDLPEPVVCQTTPS